MYNAFAWTLAAADGPAESATACVCQIRTVGLRRSKEVPNTGELTLDIWSLALVKTMRLHKTICKQPTLTIQLIDI